MPRLEHSLGLLTGGGRDLPDRQQTLRATIAWSYDLLTEGARRLLGVCSVFAGGASLEVLEAVCGAAVDIGLPVLDGLAELVDHSLLRQVRSPGPSPARYAMLETIREYAAERLAAMPEAERARGAHAAAFLALVEADGCPHAGLAKKEWLERVHTEHNNVRAALSWHRRHVCTRHGAATRARRAARIRQGGASSTSALPGSRVTLCGGIRSPPGWLSVWRR